MKHLTDFDQFGYHSDIEEDKDQEKYNKKFAEDEFLNQEFQKSKKHGDESDLDKERCYKCKKGDKPDYAPNLKAIPRLMN
jgi:hypothetical protein